LDTWSKLTAMAADSRSGGRAGRAAQDLAARITGMGGFARIRELLQTVSVTFSAHRPVMTIRRLRTTAGVRAR
jgi:hypothetical protein